MKEVKSRSEKSSSPFTNPWYNHINSTKLLYKIVLISFLGIFCPRSRRIKSHFPCQNYNRSINTRKILPPLWNTLTCHHRGCMSKQLAYEFSTASILFLKSIMHWFMKCSVNHGYIYKFNKRKLMKKIIQ